MCVAYRFCSFIAFSYLLALLNLIASLLNRRDRHYWSVNTILGEMEILGSMCLKSQSLVPQAASPLRIIVAANTRWEFAVTLTILKCFLAVTHLVCRIIFLRNADIPFMHTIWGTCSNIDANMWKRMDLSWGLTLYLTCPLWDVQMLAACWTWIYASWNCAYRSLSLANPGLCPGWFLRICEIVPQD